MKCQNTLYNYIGIHTCFKNTYLYTTNNVLWQNNEHFVFLKQECRHGSLVAVRPGPRMWWLLPAWQSQKDVRAGGQWVQLGGQLGGAREGRVWPRNNQVAGGKGP